MMRLARRYLRSFRRGSGLEHVLGFAWLGILGGDASKALWRTIRHCRALRRFVDRTSTSDVHIFNWDEHRVNTERPYFASPSWNYTLSGK